MEKEVIFYASYCNQKYFFNGDFEGLPTEIKKDLQVACISLAEKIRGAFSIGFYESGDVYIEAKEEIDLSYDEIGAELEIKKLQTEEKEMFEALTLWYRIFKGEDSEELKAQLLESRE